MMSRRSRHFKALRKSHRSIIALKYAQELLASIACQFCGAGTYEKAA
jgi:hypothetical protein